MKKRRFLKQVTAYVLAFCMLIAGMLNTDMGIVRAAELEAGDTETTTVYFYNSEGWTTVGAHAYSGSTSLTGDWGTTTAKVSDIGENWVEVEISSAPVFDVIFFDKDGDADNNRSTIHIADTSGIYGTMGGKSYTSKDAAEKAVADLPVTPDPPATTDPITVYFYNSEGWTTVGAHAYSGSASLTGNWGTTTAKASDIGENWVEVEILAVPAFDVIFFDKDGDADNNRSTIHIADTSGIYGTMGGKSYTSKDAAEKAVTDPPVTPDPPVTADSTTVYFYNNEGWTTVGAHAYSGSASLTGDWGTTTAKASDIGEDWVEVNVPATPGFNIIFFDKDGDADRNRSEVSIADLKKVYVTVGANTYESKEEAETAVSELSTVIYFLNYDGEGYKFDKVYAKVDNDEWPGIEAEEAADMGENWWQVEVPANASRTPFTVFFNGGGEDSQIKGVEISKYQGNYVTAKGDAVYPTQSEAERSVGIVNETVVYYLNSEGWEDVAAYVYGDAGNALGNWPGKDVEKADELGEDWLKVAVPAKPKFSIIFHEKNDTTELVRAELLIVSDKQVYVAGCKEKANVAVYGSQEEAELAMGMGDPSKMATLYFYNSRGWGDINGYVFREEDGESITVGSGWPGKIAEKAEDIGEKWWKLVVPRIPTKESPFYVIFNDGVNQTEDILIDGIVNVFITAAGGTYPTAKEAEAAAVNDPYDAGCEEGPNADLNGYVVNYTGAGVALPYVTYEAEAAATNAQKLEKATDYRETIQSEASGRQAVRLNNTGDYVEFTLTEAANALVLRYSMPDSADGTGIDAKLGMYINGSKVEDLELTSKYAWVYGGYPYNNNPNNQMAHRFFDETRILLDESYPAGTIIKLQKDEGNTAEYYVIDFIECEEVEAPLTQPKGSLSVEDYGAVADDGKNDREAFENCIADAQMQGKEVWIPAGNFDLPEKEALKVAGVTIRGAGMWYTNLNGAGAAFKYQGTSKFYDFAVNGVSTVRDDSGDLAGFEGTGSRATNITIQNIWMEHMKVGVWSANTDGMVIQGCRIRNTYADGINMCSATNNSTVRNNSLRNTGDDCIAIWPWLADCSGNTVAHNTIQVPTLANGVAIYGGGNNVVDSNYVADIINNGAGIAVGSEFDTAKGYTGEISVKNNVLDRCGSMQTDEDYMIGAIWIWSSRSPMTSGYAVYNNEMRDCPQVGITIECNSDLTGLNIQNNSIDGAKHAVFEYLNGTGSGKLGNLKTENIAGERIKDDAPNFILTEVDEEITDKVELKQLIATYSKVERGNYTQETWEAFIAALEAAKAIVNDEDSEQSLIDTAKENLETAYRGLKESETDPNPGPGTDPDDSGVLEDDMPENGVIPDGLWIAGGEDQTYTGKAIRPDVRVYDHDRRLKAGRDYTIGYKNNTKVNDASDKKKAPTIMVKGKGDYTGSATAVFKINPVDLNDASISVPKEIIRAYNSKKTQKVVPTVTFNGKKLANKRDFTVSYPDEGAGAYKEVGTYTIKLTGKGNFTGDISVRLEITGKILIEKAKVVKIQDKFYNDGEAITLSESELVVYMKSKDDPLKLGVDYEVREDAYENNSEIGTAAVTITGMGKYAGTKRITFKITGTSLNKASVEGIGSDKVYNGSAQYQDSMTVKLGDNILRKDIDYKVIYDKEPVNVGTVRMTIQGINQYTGTIKRTFRITACDLTTAKDGGQLTGLPENLTVKYVKGGCKPEVTLKFGDKKLVSGTDYKISYAKNTNITDANTGENMMPIMTIQGKGNFKGKLTAKFAISPKSLNDVEAPVTMTVADVGFVNKKGKYISKPVLTDVDGKVLKEATDYTLAYALEADGTELNRQSIVASADTVIRVTATGKGKYSDNGTLTATYRVTKSSFSKAKIIISSKSYTGSAIELNQDDITVKIGNAVLEYGTEYEIVEGSYVNNINKGTASVKIRGLNNYGGTKTVKFKIQAKKMEAFLNIVNAVKSGLGLR